jgi:hypothetical protein
MEKRLAKKGLKFHIKGAPVRLPADPAMPAPADTVKDI